MKKSHYNPFSRLGIALVLALVFSLSAFTGCQKSPLDPKNPVTITVWHYYTSAIESAFNEMIQEFNETVGTQKGVIVESVNKSTITKIEEDVKASAKNEPGSEKMPDIYSAYADTAYEIEKMGLLADINKYFTKSAQAEYIESYIEEGKIGLKGELRIFPIVKSSEILYINATDWEEFATDCGYTYSDLATYEKLVEAAKDYYEWTDAKTTETLNDGKAFFGRDSMANLFIIASKEFGKELFQVSKGNGTLNIDRDVMKKIWDCYYVPYISGYFHSSGKFRSEDAKTGAILSYVGSTASANYSPNEVASGGTTRPIVPKMLPMPHFEGGAKVQIQQGAGMVVAKSGNKREYASVMFLKWFTDIVNNTVFAAMNGYLPVKKSASTYNSMVSILEQAEINIIPVVDETLKVTLDAINNGSLYTNKAFDGGASARKILDSNLQTKADADRASVIALIQGGATHSNAVAQFNTNEAFEAWLSDFTSKLQAAVI